MLNVHFLFVYLLNVFSYYRKVQETELSNLLLRDPNSREVRMYRLGYSVQSPRATSGHFLQPTTSLLACVKVINEQDLSPNRERLGDGKFGTCYACTLGHYKVCVKVYKNLNSSALCHEANILSRFTHINLPYLFGVCIGNQPSIVTSLHGFKNHSITLDSVLFSNSAKVRALLPNIDWMEILLHILSGMEHLHCRHKILHNDLKGDNIVFAPTSTKVTAVIIDFGKACEIRDGKQYHLTQQEKEQYRIHHPHIAHDLCEGHCKQSTASDIYSVGRMMNIIALNSTVTDEVKKLSEQCMRYTCHLRPDVTTLKRTLFKQL